MNFNQSTLGKYLDSNKDINVPESDTVISDLTRSIMEVRALVGRLRELPASASEKPENNVIKSQLAGLVDEDLKEEVRMELDTSHAPNKEYKAITNRLNELLSDAGVLAAYREMYGRIAENKEKLKKLNDAYNTGKIDGVDLDSTDRVVVARQMIRVLDEFKYAINEEIQNIHNHVAVEKRDYRQTDRKTLEKLNEWMSDAEARISELVSTNHEVAMQLRSDQIKSDSRTLKRVKQEDVRTEQLKTTGDAYIEVPSRESVIYGGNTLDNYIMSAMRNGQNVELLGPTGTGKTKLARQAAKVFSNKDPVVLPGGPGVYRSSFYGSPSDLGKRNSGTFIKCLIEDRVMIIDEDNLIDPRQLAEIKYILGLRPGDRFIHPDTGGEFVVPPHFRVVVTRNERGKHHKDRFDLPPEYRREFTHGSFEIDYYGPQEMYDRFFLPKLTNDDGSISLSREEIGGKESDRTDRSPLLSLALAAKEIQKEYKDNKLKNAVFESGYLIDVLDQWKEMQFKKDEDGKLMKFTAYLETKLLEFIKRPIGNQDRKIIAQILYGHGFFVSYPREAFVTANDGEIFTDQEYTAMRRGASTVFKKPSGVHLSSREVALLDPFEVRKIVIPPHPLEKEVDDFADAYADFCRTFNVRPVTFTPNNFDAKKASIVDSLRKGIEKSGSDEEKIYNFTDWVNDAENASMDKFLESVASFLKIAVVRLTQSDADNGDVSPEGASANKGVEKGMTTNDKFKKMLEYYRELCADALVDAVSSKNMIEAFENRRLEWGGKKEIVDDIHELINGGSIGSGMCARNPEVAKKYEPLKAIEDRPVPDDEFADLTYDVVREIYYTVYPDKATDEDGDISPEGASVNKDIESMSHAERYEALSDNYEIICRQLGIGWDREDFLEAMKSESRGNEIAENIAKLARLLFHFGHQEMEKVAKRLEKEDWDYASWTVEKFTKEMLKLSNKVLDAKVGAATGPASSSGAGVPTEGASAHKDINSMSYKDKMSELMRRYKELCGWSNTRSKNTMIHPVVKVMRASVEHNFLNEKELKKIANDLIEITRVYGLTHKYMPARKRLSIIISMESVGGVQFTKSVNDALALVRDIWQDVTTIAGNDEIAPILTHNN